MARLLRARGLDPDLLDCRSEEVLPRLQAMRSPVVLVEDGASDVAFTDTLGDLLKENPRIAVIHVSLQSNQLGLYSATQIKVTGAEDLVNAIAFLSRWSEGLPQEIEEPAPVS